MSPRTEVHSAILAAPPGTGDGGRVVLQIGKDVYVASIAPWETTTCDTLERARLRFQLTCAEAIGDNYKEVYS